MHPIKALLDELKRLEAKEHLIFPHQRADGDALAASVAMASLLEQNGKKAVILLSEALPAYLSPFTAGLDVQVYEKGQGYDSDRANILVDCHAADRLEGRAELLAKGRLFVVDHHLSEADLPHSWIDPTRASTADMFAEALVSIEKGELAPWTYRFTPELATAVLMGIYSDTGGFRYGNTIEKAFQGAKDLTERGANVVLIAQKLFADDRIERQRLKGKVLSEFELLAEGIMAAAIIDRDYYIEHELEPSDFEGLCNLILDTLGCKLAVLMRELPSKSWQISLRSKSGVDVASLAAAYGGGGHRQAAGLTLTPKQMGDLFPLCTKAERPRALLKAFVSRLSFE